MVQIRVFLADDHDAMRERIANLLATECDIVGSATDGREPLFSDMDWPREKLDALVQAVSNLEEQPSIDEMIQLCVR